MMKENRLRRLLKEGRPSTATRLSSVWPFYTEMVGVTGNFDYVEFLAEYAPFSQNDLENLARAAELYDMGSMIKVDFQNRGYVAQKAAGSGFQAINFTDHPTSREVEETIKMMKPCTPMDGGTFGYPSRRFISCAPVPHQMAHADRVRDIVLCFMIEKKTAVDDIENICRLPGVDMVQFGPSDYAMSRGWIAGEHKKEIQEAQRHVIRVALEKGVQPRCEINTWQEAGYYIDLGVRHFCLGDQIKVLNDYWTHEGKKMRSIADEL